MFRLKPKYFWCFQGVQNGKIDHEWVNLYKIERGLTQGIELVLSITVYLQELKILHVHGFL